MSSRLRGHVDRAAHLGSRLVDSLRRGGPPPSDEAWLVGLLSPAQTHLYLAQSELDRRHSVRCAVAVRDLEAGGPTLVVASALHDVGKVQSELGTLGRVVATLIAAVAGSERTDKWMTGGGVRARVGRYDHHDALGAAMLAEAGSEPVVVAWAAEHHHRSPEIGAAAAVVARLEAADRA